MSNSLDNFFILRRVSGCLILLSSISSIVYWSGRYMGLSFIFAFNISTSMEAPLALCYSKQGSIATITITGCWSCLPRKSSIDFDTLVRQRERVRQEDAQFVSYFYSIMNWNADRWNWNADENEKLCQFSNVKKSADALAKIWTLYTLRCSQENDVKLNLSCYYY